jgi:hypothetical protein
MFYTYLWLRYDGTPYYVGKGLGNRAYHRHDRNLRPPVDKSRVLIEHHDSEDAAYEAETFLISYYGRLDIGTGCLRNMTDGGEGSSGRSEEVRRKVSLALQGHPVSEATRNKFREASKGNKNRLGAKLSEESKKKISQSRSGKYSAWNAGIPWSEEVRQKMSESAKKKPPISEETRKKLSETSSSRWLDPEFRARMSALRVQVWAKRKARLAMAAVA